MKLATLLAYSFLGLLAFLPGRLDGLSLEKSPSRSQPPSVQSRRDLLTATSVAAASLFLSSPTPAWAVADCFDDCFKNCKKVAPKDPEYCTTNCRDYCDQDDRQDGLSGSVSSDSGEVGILGGTFGQGTVPKDEDKVGLPRQIGGGDSSLARSARKFFVFVLLTLLCFPFTSLPLSKFLD